MSLNLRNRIQDYVRVLKITRKPSREEYSAAVKITGIGIVLIGLVGFFLYLLNLYTSIFR